MKTRKDDGLDEVRDALRQAFPMLNNNHLRLLLDRARRFNQIKGGA